MHYTLPRRFPPKSEITADLVDAILRELWRWRKLDVAGALVKDCVDSDEPPRLWVADLGQVVPALAPGTTVAAGSVAAPTAFTATLLLPTATTSADGSLDGTAMQQVDAYNQYPGTIAAGSLIWLVNSFGNWYVLTAACSS